MSSAQLTPEGAPLTPEEQKMVARIFSDPFYFPLQFKTWLQWFIEGVEGGIAGGGSGGGSGGSIAVPIGGVIFWTTNKLPSSFLWCDGAAYSRTQYNRLFQEIGVGFGAGDGSTTFNVPDADGRDIVSWARSGGHPDASTLGQTEGQPKGQRTPRHGHTVAVNEPPHSHPGGNYAHSNTTGNDPFAVVGGEVFASDPIPAVQIGVSVVVGPAGVPANDQAAHIVLPAIIRYV